MSHVTNFSLSDWSIADYSKSLRWIFMVSGSDGYYAMTTTARTVKALTIGRNDSNNYGNRSSKNINSNKYSQWQQQQQQQQQEKQKKQSQ